MVEATPDRPYTGYTTDLLRVERNMRLRRMRMLTVLNNETELAPTVSAYFMLGAQGDDGAVPPVQVGGDRTQSDYIGDGIINPHPRFGTLTANIRSRRGSKVCIQVPLFRDTYTPEYQDYPPQQNSGTDGCCGGDAQQLWRYGKGDAATEKYGVGHVEVGCTKTTADEEFDDSSAVERGAVMQKWLVDVKCVGCKGLFYRSAPGVIVADADWPRNGDIVVGHELIHHPGWIRLQNGYYLPIDDGGNGEGDKIQFLSKVSQRAKASNSEMKRFGSGTPLFKGNSNNNNMASAAALLAASSIDEITVDESITASKKASDELPSIVPSVSEEDAKENIRAAIHMDAMAFGMGCCCLQITFQCKDVDESRFLYDQLAVMTPIMMALTASTPILKGRLADTDCRWGIISESVDCRTPAERGRPDPNAPYEENAAKGQRRIYKSRYDSISAFIYPGAIAPTMEGNSSDAENKGNNDGEDKGLGNRVLNMYNDIPVPVDEESYEKLLEAGIDPTLAQHVAHLFIRDPLVVFDGAVEEVDDDTQTEHWESLQSTNW